MRTSQNLENKRQKLTQVANQPPPPPNTIKHPNNANTAKINMAGNNKKVPMFNEKQSPQIVRTNSMQPEIPKPAFTKNKGCEMDIEEEYYTNHQTNSRQPINNFMSNQSTNYTSNKMGYQF